MELLSHSELLCVTGLGLVIFIIVKLYYNRKYSYWSNKWVSSLSASIPFGNMADQILNRTSQGELVAKQYAYFNKLGVKFGGVYLITSPVIIPLDPELIKTIMVKEFASFHDRPFSFDTDLDPLLGHLFLLKGTEWRDMRNKLSPTFTSGKMKMMFSTLLTCGNELEQALIESVRKAEPIEIKDILARFTTDVIGSCAFGLDCNSLKNPNAEFRKYGRMIFEFNKWDVLRRTIALFMPIIARLLRISVIKKVVRDFFMNAIKETLEYREQNHTERKDFMNLLIKLKNNESIDDDNVNLKIATKFSAPALTFNQLAAQCFVFFLAGFETSSSTMTFCLFELCQNPDIQEKLRNEIFQTLKKHNGQLTYESISEMSYLDKVVKETLRKYPIVPALMRECVQKFQIPESDVILEKNTIVFISVLGLHRNPKFYPNPMKFDPERFSDEEKAKRHPFTYLPFGEGPRNCIGMRFGLMQTKVGLALLLRRFKFTLNEKTNLPIVFDPTAFVLSVKEGIWLNAHNIVS